MSQALTRNVCCFAHACRCFGRDIWHNRLASGASLHRSSQNYTLKQAYLQCTSDTDAEMIRNLRTEKEAAPSSVMAAVRNVCCGGARVLVRRASCCNYAIRPIKSGAHNSWRVTDTLVTEIFDPASKFKRVVRVCCMRDICRKF